jgi:hypothetical protein
VASVFCVPIATVLAPGNDPHVVTDAYSEPQSITMPVRFAGVFESPMSPSTNRALPWPIPWGSVDFDSLRRSAAARQTLPLQPFWRVISFLCLILCEATFRDDSSDCGWGACKSEMVVASFAGHPATRSRRDSVAG